MSPTSVSGLRHALVLAAFALAGCGAARAGELVESSLETALVPGPVRLAVLLPPNYETSGKDYPLLLWLHGGNGDNGFLKGTRPTFEALWARGETPEMVVATPDADRSFYLDYRDGSQKWETFIVEELLPYLRATYRVSTKPDRTFVGGVSMGGMGSLRLGLKHTDVFGAIVALEPGIEPAFEWKDVKIEDKFYRAPSVMEERFGKPIDEAYWAANNPATIARDEAERIRDSGIRILVEVGSEDFFGLDRGAEFLHRTLFDLKIRHDFHYVLGGDHVGKSLAPRIRSALGFLGRVVAPPEPDPVLRAARAGIRRLKTEAGLPE